MHCCIKHWRLERIRFRRMMARGLYTHLLTLNFIHEQYQKQQTWDIPTWLCLDCGNIKITATITFNQIAWLWNSSLPGTFFLSLLNKLQRFFFIIKLVLFHRTNSTFKQMFWIGFKITSAKRNTVHLFSSILLPSPLCLCPESKPPY